MNIPLISIGVTCFNAETTIERAIHSAINQGWENKEIIIVDDCSADSSTEKIRKIISGHDSARLIIHDQNIGPAGSRNTILDQARGEFVVFFDDDDESTPERVEKQYERLIEFEHKHGVLVACYASGVRNYDNGYKKELKAIGSIIGREPYGTDVADYLLYYKKKHNFYYGSGTPSCTLFARLSTFQTIGGFDASLKRVEDVDFAFRLALQDGYFIGTEEKLFVQYSTSAPDKNPDKNLVAEQALVKKHKEYLINKQKYYYSYHWPLLRYYYFKRQYHWLAVTFIQIFIRHPFYSLNHLLSSGTRRILHDLRISK